MAKKSFIKELRESYPTMSLMTFIRIVDAHNAEFTDALLEELDKAEERARAEEEHAWEQG